VRAVVEEGGEDGGVGAGPGKAACAAGVQGCVLFCGCCDGERSAVEVVAAAQWRVGIAWSALVHVREVFLHGRSGEHVDIVLCQTAWLDDVLEHVIVQAGLGRSLKVKTSPVDVCLCHERQHD